MNKHPILIRNVRHLTDARYFAAMEVDWMTIQLTEDPLTFSVWHNLKEWISGVKLAAELKTDNESVIAKTIIDASPDGIVTDNLDIIHLTGGLDLILLGESIRQSLAGDVYAQIIHYSEYGFEPDRLPSILPEIIFLEADWTPALVTELKERDYSGGFCFSSGDESATGIKDYTEMDAVIELIRS